MIYFRADANETLASGHIMRCITIALEFVQEGNAVTFLIADANPRVLLERYKLPYIILNTDWNNLEGELEVLVPILKNPEDILIIDSYLVTENYMNTVYTKVKTVYIEDQMQKKYSTHILINYNLYYFIFDYPRKYQDSGTRLFLGAQYTPLRSEFSEHKAYEVRKKARDILVMCGGGDEKGFLKSFLSEISDIGTLHFHIVIGAYNKDKKELKKRYEGRDNIYMYENISNINEVMRMCDIAVSAAGNTLYELCAVGTPTIFFTYSYNQKYDYIGFTENDIMLYAGNIDDGKERIIKNITRYVTSLIDNREERFKMSNKMTYLIDGLGAKRIVKNILEDEKNVDNTSA